MTVQLTIADLHELAAARLPRAAYDYYASGAEDEHTLAENEAGWARVRLRPRCLVDVSTRDLSTTVLGKHVSMPVLVAPTAFQRMAHPDGELATARAASAAATVMVLSTLATTTLEDVAAAYDAKRRDAGGRWFQLYVYRDRGVTRALVERAEAAGYDALVLTVDTPYLGRRLRDVRNGFALPQGLSVANLVGHGKGALGEAAGESGLAAYVTAMLDPSLTWRDVEWLRSITRLPVVIKGVLRDDDARLAASHGASAVVVSNHGGRQLDGAISTAAALPEVVDAVGDALEVYVDGGVRRGSDVLRALALGARAVLVGRPVLWGLACDGEPGVATALEMLRAELDLSMALAGCVSASGVARDGLVHPVESARRGP
ncbi:MAG TPA: alpha-hydroxy acid oxidase [Gemmatimonadaceae bacterium]